MSCLAQKYAQTWLELREVESATGVPARDDASLDDKFMAVADFEAAALHDADCGWKGVFETWLLLPKENEAITAYFAAGLLENMVVNHFDFVFPKLESLVQKEPQFAKALSMVWPQDLSETNWSKLQTLITLHHK
jgi:hypothetical protein